MNFAKKEIRENILPELKENKDISTYDIIFIGTPAWWYTMAPAVHTFLIQVIFQAKLLLHLLPMEEAGNTL